MKQFRNMSEQIVFATQFAISLDRRITQQRMPLGRNAALTTSERVALWEKDARDSALDDASGALESYRRALKDQS